MEKRPILQEDVLPVCCIDGSPKRARWRECSVGEEGDSYRKKFETLSSMHGRDPDPRDGPIVRAGLKDHRLDPSGAQRSMDPLHVRFTCAKHAYVRKSDLIRWERTEPSYQPL